MGVPTPEAQAIALFQAGRFAEAEAPFRAILARDPANRDALLALGIIAGQSQRREEAVDLLGRAAALDPRSYAVFFHLGSALRQSGRQPAAAEAFRRAIAIDARAPEAHVGLANTLREAGDRVGARASFGAALAIDPAFASAHYNLALLEIDAGNLAAAESRLARVLEREPRNAAAWNNLGLVMRKAGSGERARQCFERAVELDPKAAEALNNLGLERQREERIDEAIALYARALEIRPEFAQALTHWGNALKDRGDLAGALERYQRALAADPRDANALVNSGSIALERGDRGAARRFYERALDARADFADARYSLGLIALIEHDFEHGWDGYERRFETDPPVAAIGGPRLPRLPASGLARVRRLAVRAEQGLGDQILFSTLLPELGERNLAAVVELDERLLGIYRRSLPQLEFTSPVNATAALSKCDHELALGSLAALLRRSRASFDAQPRVLLVPDPARVEAMRDALGAGPTIAISWRSFQKAGRRHIGERKSIPLERFAALAGAGIRLVDLQYGEVSAERDAFDRAHPGLRVEIPGLDLRNDLEGVLAAVAVADLVITASNVTAHFAGAIGKRTWLVYLAANPPFHYWAPRDDGRSPWYPSVEVITAPQWSRWEEAFEAIAERLKREVIGSR